MGDSGDDHGDEHRSDPGPGPGRRRGGIPRPHRPVPARAAGPLLPDPRLAPGRRGRGPGDAALGLARAGRVRGTGLAALLALPDRHQPLPQRAPRQRPEARAMFGLTVAAERARADPPGGADLAAALPRRAARGPARPRRRPRRPLRDQGGGRPRLRLRPAADAAAAAGGAGAARRARLPRRRGGGDAGDQRGLGQQRPAAGAGGARGGAGAAGRRHRPRLAGAARACSSASPRPSRPATSTPCSSCCARTPGSGCRRSRYEYKGRPAIGEFLRTRPLWREGGAAAAGPDPRQRPARLRLLPAATRRPTSAGSAASSCSPWRASEIAAITRFGEGGWLPWFGLPRTLPGLAEGGRRRFSRRERRGRGARLLGGERRRRRALWRRR